MLQLSDKLSLIFAFLYAATGLPGQEMTVFKLDLNIL
jgi:hypothetical protein